MLNINIAPAINNYNSPTHKIFKMGSNERTAGSMPIWDNPSTNKEKSIQNIENAINKTYKTEKALAYNNIQHKTISANEFKFADIIDMVNPLQHIPIINNIYRNITGDEIKPISKIVGGGIFTGVIGATSGVIDVISKKETGKTITENIKNIINSKSDLSKNDTESKINKTPINKGISANPNNNNNLYKNLPDTTIVYADMSYIPSNKSTYQRIHEDNNRYNS